MSARTGARFRLLGPLEVWDGEQEVALGGARQRALLALLLLRRGQVVPAEQLAEELWSGASPAGAAKTLQVYMSRLRRALGEGVVATRGGGYVLELGRDEVDADRFEALVAEGRDRLAAGDADGAARVLREALGLWRGPALADRRYEAFAQSEIARLEEARLAAFEERIEADLARRRHAEVIPELDRLVREHPLRERLRGQQMRALYGTGRQAEALEAYRAAREVLVDELGIEPGPELRDLERRILEQDTTLGVPARRGPAVPTRRRGALALVLGGALLLAAGIAAVVAALSGGGTRAALKNAAPDSLAVIDPHRAALVADIPTGSGPAAVAVGAGSVWVANGGDQTLARVDPGAREVVDRVGLGRIPSRLTFGDRALWVASALGDRGVVLRVDPGSETVTGRTSVRIGVPGMDYFAPPTPSALAVGAGGVWANSGHAHVTVVGSAGRRRVLNLGAQHAADGIAIGAGGVWVASGSDDRVLRLDPRTGRVVAAIRITATPQARLASPYGVAVGYGSVWVTDALSNTVSRIDPRFNAVQATISVGRRPTRVAVGEGGIWVLSAGDGSVARIDPRSDAVTARVHVGPGASDLAAGEGRIWVTVGGGAPRIGGRRPPPRAVPLTAPGCSTLVRGPGAPQLLIASDLPTYVPGPSPEPLILDARAAIRLVLREHGFRAGRFRIGYQACDSSTRAAGPSPQRCAQNARAYALDPSVVGVMGPFHSFCTEVELPTLDAAPGGPVAVISPTNTYVGLTRSGPSTAADEPERYYPAGVRNYARLTAPDDEQSAAVATFLHELGRRRLYLLDDDEPTGFAGAVYAARAAGATGLAVAGHAVWHAGGRSYRPLARRIARTGADAVLLSGCICTDGGRLVRDLRAVLGNRVTLIGTDNFTAQGGFLHAHGVFDGIYITTAGRPPEALPAARSLLARLAPLRPPEQIDPSTAYAAQAAEVLLRAIAASDGSRASVTRALLATRLWDGPTGTVSFDRVGDPSPAPFAVYRVDSHTPPRGHRGVAGEVLDRVVEPAPQLVR
jgi:YVTN family beta-propeller protein